MGLLNMLLFKRKTRRRSILALDHYNWFGFDYGKVRKAIESFDIDYHSINISDARNAPEHKVIDAEFTYQAVIYTVCNELELVPADIDLNNPDHAEVYCKWTRIVTSCTSHIEKKIDDCGITKIFIPQGYALEAAVCRLLAVKNNLQILTIENTLSKERMLWENISGITVNSNLSKNYYWKYAPLTTTQKASDYTQKYLTNVKSIKSSEHATPDVCSLKIDEQKKTILFLGQVYVDSSVIFGINRFQSQERIIEHLCDYCARNGYTLIVKLHPKEIHGMSFSNKPLDKMTWRKICNMKSYVEKYHDHPDVIIDHENLYDTYRLIEWADVCVTVNSMAGLEACVKGKWVVICGHACFGGLGFTADAYDYEDLNYYLDKTLAYEREKFDKLHEDAMKFFYIYMNLYCVERTESELVKLLVN
jgi:hypothetical protein